MKTSADFYESFDKAGFLKTALWTPSVGLPAAGVQQSARVRYRAPTEGVLGGEADAEAHSIEYPATKLLGLRRGEAITVDGDAYLVNTDPKQRLDGSVLRALLSVKTT